MRERGLEQSAIIFMQGRSETDAVLVCRARANGGHVKGRVAEIPTAGCVRADVARFGREREDDATCVIRMHAKSGKKPSAEHFCRL